MSDMNFNDLKKAGFKIMDVNFAADNTILEEGTELIHKIQKYVLYVCSHNYSFPKIRSITQLTPVALILSAVQISPFCRCSTMFFISGN